MDNCTVELIEKIGRVKLLVEEIPVMFHRSSCPADDDTGWPAPCNCAADKFNGAVEKVKHELGISHIQKIIKRIQDGAVQDQ
jgi:hypothetical protein